jgi:hypothetical protein
MFFASSRKKQAYEKIILISSMGRSGSTLFSNLVNCTSDFKEVFEPFFPEKVKAAKPFIYPKYLAPDNDDRRYLKPAKKILEGFARNKWIDQAKSNRAAKRLLIKDIRTNLFLKWIDAHFPEVEIILLMRNPFAVVSSWIRANFGVGSVARERILSQDDLMRDHLSPFKEEYLAIDDTFLRLIFFWCIYYYVPLQQFDSKNITIAFYENLVTNANKEMEIIGKRLSLGIQYTCANEVVKIPSRMTMKGRDTKDIGRIDRWSQGIETPIIDKSFNILSLFGMDKFYARNGMPDKAAVLEFLNS